MAGHRRRNLAYLTVLVISALAAVITLAGPGPTAAAATPARPATPTRPAAATPGTGTSPGAAAASLRGPIGLNDWRDLNELPVNPVGVQTRMFSSADLTGGNDDGFDGYYSCLRYVAQGCVIADDHGAGEIDTMWFTRDGGPETKTGDIIVILDGHTVIDAPLTDVVNGRLGAPFVHPLVANYQQNSGGNYIAVPMTYHSSMLVITANNPQFYQVTYRHFDSASGVPTFSQPADSGSDVVSTLTRAGTQDPKAALPGATTADVPFRLSPGHRVTLASLHGPAEISAFRLNIPGLLGMTQPPQEVSDDGRGFAADGSSQFTMTIDPRNDGVRLTRRLDGNIANQVADVYVDGQYAGRWAPEPEQWGLFATENFDIPAALTQGKSKITIKNAFVSSAGNFTEYAYGAYSSVGGQWLQTDHLDVGPDHAADEQAHNYVIMTSDFAGTTTRELLPTTTDPAAVAATDDILAHTLVQVSFDGQQTVDVPLGQFFGSGLGKWRIRSLFTAMDGGAGGWMSSWWPMPYARSAVITLVNDSQTPIRSGTAQITSAPGAQWAAELGPGGHAGYFRATYHDGPTTQGRDVNWLSADGAGKFVGVFMTMEGTDPSLGRQFMEGDHRGYADGSRTPQIQGTGTEDIGLGGWYFNQGMFTGPFSGDPWQQGAQDGCVANCTGEYRLWIPDSMTFASSIAIGQEHGQTDNVPADYGTTAFWYGRPRLSGVQTDSLTVGNAASESAHHYTSDRLCTPNAVTNTYEGDDGPFEGLPAADVTAAVSQMTSPISFRLKINSDNHGVVLERSSDQVYGYQAAEVYVNGADAGDWQQPHANPYHTWLDDSFELPASLTRGYTELGIQLVHMPGTFAWTAASYRAVSLVGGLGLPPGQAPIRRPGFPPSTSSCAVTTGSPSPGTAAAGQIVTITGSGFGARQGSGYVVLTDNGTSWGMAADYPFISGYTGIAPGDAGGISVDSWSDTRITFTLPAPRNGYHLWAGTPASATVINGSGIISNAATIEITPTSSMSDYYDNAGISDNANVKPGNFDGSGTSYSAEALAAAGLAPGTAITHDGLEFTWPNVPAGQPDNVITAGQTIVLPGSGTTLGFLGAAVKGGATGTGTISYTDGTTQQFTLAMPDWWSNIAPSGGDILATMPTLNFQTGPGSHEVSVYYDAVALQPGKAVRDITLPNVRNMHVFAIAIG